MTTSISRPDRRFQMWHYLVGHGTLLLRSTKSERFATRIDVLLKNVSAMHLLSTLEGLAISVATDAESDELRAAGWPQGTLADRQVFVVRAAGFRGYVIAGLVTSHEDEGEYYSPSHFQHLLE